MKLNNKGFTVIEIIMSFSFILVISISLFEIALNYTFKQQLESSRRDLITLKNLVVNDIQKDIIEKQLVSISDVNNNSVVFTFLDRTTKVLTVETIGDSVHPKALIYGNVIYEFKESDIISIGTMTKTRAVQNFGIGKNYIYKLVIPIAHNDLQGNYSIRIITNVFNRR